MLGGRAEQRKGCDAAHEACLLDLPQELVEGILRLLTSRPRDWATAGLACRALHTAGQAVAPLPKIDVSEKGLPWLCKAVVRRRRRAHGGCAPLSRQLSVQPTTLRASAHQLLGLLGVLAGPSAPEALELRWISGWHHSQRNASKLVVRLAQMTALQRLHLQLTNGMGQAAFDPSPLAALPRLCDLRLDFDSAQPQFELQQLAAAGERSRGFTALTCLALAHMHPPSTMPRPASVALLAPALLPALRRLELRSWHMLAIVGHAAVEGWRVPEVRVAGPCIAQHYARLAPLALELDCCLRLPNMEYDQLQSLRLRKVESLSTLFAPPPPMPQLAELHVGQAVGREGQVAELVRACTASLRRVCCQPCAQPFRAYCAGRGLSHWQALVEGEGEGQGAGGAAACAEA